MPYQHGSKLIDFHVKLVVSTDPITSSSVYQNRLIQSIDTDLI